MPALTPENTQNETPFDAYPREENELRLTDGFVSTEERYAARLDPTLIVRRLTQLEQSSGLWTISRVQSAASLSILQMLRNGDTVEDIFSEQAEDRRIEVSERLNERISRLSPSEPAELGRFCRELMDGIQAQIIPGCDLSDYEQTSRNAHVLNTAWQTCMDVSQIFTPYWNNPQFQEGFLNRQAGETWDNTYHDQFEQMINVGRSLYMFTAQTPPENGNSLSNTISRFLMAQYGQVFQNNRTLTELADMIDGTALYSMASALTGMARNNPSLQQEMDAYADNPGRPLSENFRRVMSGAGVEIRPGSALRGSETISEPVFPKDRAARLFRPGNWYDPVLRDDIDAVFQQMFDTPDLHRTARVMQRNGFPVESPIQLFHIGSQSVDEYLTSNHIVINDENRKAAIVQAASMAREHVSRIGFSLENGPPAPSVVDIHADLTAFKGMEGFFERSRPRRAAQLYASDRNMAERHADILKGFGATRRTNMEAAAPTTRAPEAGTVTAGTAAAASAAESAASGAAEAAPTTENAAASRSEDIVANNRTVFQNTRKEYDVAGSIMAQEGLFDAEKDALLQLEPEQVANRMRTNIQNLARTNLRNETLSMLGVEDPDSLRPDEAARILNSAENRPRVAAFLCEYSRLVEQAYERLDHPFGVEYDGSPEERAYASALNATLTPEEKQSYRALCENIRKLAEPAFQLGEQYAAGEPGYEATHSAEILANAAAFSYSCSLIGNHRNLALVRPERVQMMDSLRDLVKNDAARQNRSGDARAALDTGRLPQDIQKMTDQFLQTSQKMKVGFQGIADTPARESRRPARSPQPAAQNQLVNQNSGTRRPAAPKSL